MIRGMIMSGTYEVKIPIKYEFIDLGLSVNWATCNIGATKPEEYGWYFQWGGTTPYNSDRTPVEGGNVVNFNWNANCPYWVSGSSSLSKWSKYTATNDYSSIGTADNKLILEPEDDVVYVHIGGDCRMPTEEEYQELIDACNTKWMENYNNTGINGMLFILKSDSSKTLFFSASGDLSGTSWTHAGSGGNYWSSSIYSFNSSRAHGWYFDPDDFGVGNAYRYYGRPVRGVLPK